MRRGRLQKCGVGPAVDIFKNYLHKNISAIFLVDQLLCADIERNESGDHPEPTASLERARVAASPVAVGEEDEGER